MDLDFVVDEKLRELSGEETWEAIENFAQGQKEWDNPLNIISEHEIEILKEYTPPVTYPEEVEETLETPIGVEPLDETQLEDLGLNTCNHEIPLSSREVPSFDGPEPQPLSNCPSSYVSLGEEKCPEPPIKPYSSDSFRTKVVDNLTIHTPPSPHMASSHPKDTYFYYLSCIDDPKKHYRFKPGLLGHNGSLGVDYLNMKMIEDDWGLESKEVSFLGKGLNSPVILMRKSLEVLRKFHWMILGGRFNQLSHVSSPLLSKPGEY
ncbi:hypothetical protein Tco_1085627 [Tanacetum coccineum]